MKVYQLNNFANHFCNSGVSLESIKVSFLRLVCCFAFLSSLFVAQTGFAQGVVINFASQTKTMQSKVIQPDFKTKSPNCFVVLGEVAKPNCYQLQNATPTVADVLKHAGGETAASSGSVRVIRSGRAGLRLMPAAIDTYQLMAGDLLVVERKHVHQARSVQFGKTNQTTTVDSTPHSQDTLVSVGLMNVTGTPVVLNLKPENATLSYILTNVLQQDIYSQGRIQGTVKVIAPKVQPVSSTRIAPTKTALASGTVLVFKKGTIDDKKYAKLPAPIDTTTPTGVSKSLLPETITVSTAASVKPLQPFGRSPSLKATSTEAEPAKFPTLVPAITLPNSSSKPLSFNPISETNTAKKFTQSSPELKISKAATEPSFSASHDTTPPSVPSSVPSSNLSSEDVLQLASNQPIDDANSDGTTSFSPPFMAEEGSITREPLPPKEGDAGNHAVPMPMEVAMNSNESTGLSDLSLVGLISGVGILVAVLSVLISALWSQLDEAAQMQQEATAETAAPTQFEQMIQTEMVLTNQRTSETPLKSERSSLQALIENNIPFVEEGVDTPSDVEFYGSASKSHSYRIDVAHERTTPVDSNREFAPPIPVPNIAKPSRRKKKTTDTVSSNTVSVDTESQKLETERMETPQIVMPPDQSIITDLDHIKTDDPSSSPQASGLLDRALDAMHRERKTS